MTPPHPQIIYGHNPSNSPIAQQRPPVSMQPPSSPLPRLPTNPSLEAQAVADTSGMQSTPLPQDSPLPSDEGDIEEQWDLHLVAEEDDINPPKPLLSDEDPHDVANLDDLEGMLDDTTSVAGSALSVRSGSTQCANKSKRRRRETAVEIATRYEKVLPVEGGQLQMLRTICATMLV